MRCLIKKISIFFLFLVPVAACAGWQVAGQSSGLPVSSDPFFQTGNIPKAKTYTKEQTADAYYKTVYPKPKAHKTYTYSYAAPKAKPSYTRPSSMYAISVSGSLKENLERIMDRYHWKVIWQVPYDYNFDGRVTGTSLPNVVEKLLTPFPLQAVMYMSNRTMTITPRKA